MYNSLSLSKLTGCAPAVCKLSRLKKRNTNKELTSKREELESVTVDHVSLSGEKEREREREREREKRYRDERELLSWQSFAVYSASLTMLLIMINHQGLMGKKKPNVAYEIFK